MSLSNGSVIGAMQLSQKEIKLGRLNVVDDKMLAEHVWFTELR